MIKLSRSDGNFVKISYPSFVTSTVYAHSLNYTLNRISNIAKEEKQHHLSVLSFQYQFAEAAFVKMCEKYIPNGEKSSFFFRYVDNMDLIITELKSGTCDVAIGICREDLYHIQKKTFLSVFSLISQERQEDTLINEYLLKIREYL